MWAYIPAHVSGQEICWEPACKSAEHSRLRCSWIQVGCAAVDLPVWQQHTGNLRPRHSAVVCCREPITAGGDVQGVTCRLWHRI